MKRKLMAELVLSKWTGLLGTAMIASERREELSGFFPGSFLETAAGFKVYGSVSEEIRLAEEYGAAAYREVKAGGIYGCLWELGAELKTGLKVSLRDIPIRQETVEIAEYYDIDPYLLYSGGALLIVCDRGYELMRGLMEKGIHASVIGALSDDNDRVAVCGDRRRFLSPRYKDELFKVIPGAKVADLAGGDLNGKKTGKERQDRRYG